jgi:small subunit ribosomal protein S16
VKVRVGTGGSADPLLTLLFEEQAASAMANAMIRPDMACVIARLTGWGGVGRFRRSMAVAIRFSRQGKKKAPFYRIVAADKRCARDGRFIELLGTYHPKTKVLKLDKDKYEKWIKVGAQPSGTLSAIVHRTERNAAKVAGT